jgi:hypothetical protein
VSATGLLAGGSFTQAGGHLANHIAEWDADDGPTDQSNAHPRCDTHNPFKSKHRLRSVRDSNGYIVDYRADGTPMLPVGRRPPDEQPAVDAELNPSSAFMVNDLMDGGTGDDAMAGDNVIIWRRGDDYSPRFRVLVGQTNSLWNEGIFETLIDATNLNQSFVRQAQLRLTGRLAPGLTGQISIEAPETGYTSAEGVFTPGASLQGGHAA